MPVVESSVVVPVPPEVAFWVSQTYGPVRYRWDPFVHSQHLIGAEDFVVRPWWLAPIGDRVGAWYLGRDIERRIRGFAGGCSDHLVLEAAEAAREAHTTRG